VDKPNLHLMLNVVTLTMMARVSGVQRDVLSLYRQILREALRKDRSSSDDKTSFVTLISGARAHNTKQTTSTAYAVVEFRRQAATATRSEFKKIEYMIRKGHKQVKLLQMPGVRVVGGA
jgi:succinate dehydrogenase assembly factor 1